MRQRQRGPSNPEGTSLTRDQNGSTPGGVVGCTLAFVEPSGFRGRLESIDFEDGEDEDFDDLIVTVTAIPAS